MILKYILCIIAFSAVTSLSHAAWQHAHGDSANTGFARVDTDPAASSMRTAPLGPLAPGANPVVGPDGTVYIGNLYGELRAFHADGTPYWTRQLNDSHGGIAAAPVVGADGSVYVVSAKKTQYHDHRNGENYISYESFLHKFSPGGAWVFAAPFPDHPLSGVANRGATTAPPNITRGGDAIIVPVLYDVLGGRDLRPIAFSASGGVLADALVSCTRYEITSHSFLDDLADFLACTHLVVDGCDFVDKGYVPFSEAGFPMPGVAIYQSPRPGSTPSIWMSDSMHDKITYTLSPEEGLVEAFRSTHTARQFTTPPVVANGKVAVGTADGYLTFTGLNFVQWAAAGGLGYLTAAPTRLNDGRLVVIARDGWMTVLSGNNFVVSQSQLAGQSIASAAASCTHVFVSTTSEFITFNAKTLAQVASVPWEGGGLAAPVIGPSGHVYAIASDNLYVFPPPRFGNVLGKTACDQLTSG